MAGHGSLYIQLSPLYHREEGVKEGSRSRCIGDGMDLSGGMNSTPKRHEMEGYLFLVGSMHKA
jgi:hypothetical protein